MRLRWTWFALMLTIAACATPVEYGPIGKSPFGYRDHENPDGSFTILVIAPNAAVAHNFWDQRAVELCGSADYKKNIFRAEIPVVTTSGYATNPNNPSYGGSYTQDVYGAPRLEGYLRCNSPEANPAPAPAPEGEEGDVAGNAPPP